MNNLEVDSCHPTDPARWIEKEVRDNPHDEELLDILKDKAINEKTWEAVAREREVTTRALWNRVARFKKKYVPRWRRYRTLLLAGAFVIIAILCAAAYVILESFAQPAESPGERIGPDRARKPAPTTAPTVSGAPSVFEPATGPSGTPPAHERQK